MVTELFSMLSSTRHPTIHRENGRGGPLHPKAQIGPFSIANRLVKGLKASYNCMSEDDPEKQVNQLNSMSQNLVSNSTRLIGIPSTLSKLMLKMAPLKKEPKASESADFVHMMP